MSDVFLCDVCPTLPFIQESLLPPQDFSLVKPTKQHSRNKMIVGCAHYSYINNKCTTAAAAVALSYSPPLSPTSLGERKKRYATM